MSPVFQKVQLAVIILCVLTLLLIFSLVFEKTIVNGECENCNKFFHNFSTNCTYGLFGKAQVIFEETQFTNAIIEKQTLNNNFQSNTILTKTTSSIDEDYLNNITFIGDSRFVALVKYDIEQSNIFAKSGLNHKQALTQSFVELPNGENVTLVEALANNQNDIILINFGVNGAGWFTDDEFITNYHELLDIIEENTNDVTIIIQSILPIAKSYEYKENGFPNIRIDYLNEILFEISNERGFYYLDSSDVLKDDDNFLDTKYTNDGLHFNDEGYELLLQHIKEYTIYK